MTTTRISTKGQIILPATLRRRDQVRPGQRFEIERTGPGEYVLRRVAERANEGFVDLLLACPAKDWFRPADRSESTDDAKLPALG